MVRQFQSGAYVSIGFVLKKAIGHCLYPLTLMVLLLVVGSALLWTKKRRNLGRRLVLVGCVLSVLFTVGPLPAMLLRPLEWQFMPHEDLSVPVDYIVVLGAGHKLDQTLPAALRLNDTARARLAEALRQLQLYPQAKLVLSGGTIVGDEAIADVMADAAESLGIEAERIVRERSGLDTEGEAELLSESYGREKLLLVTSASHMPRAMMLFNKQGIVAQPAPAYYLTTPGFRLVPGDLFPSSSGLRYARIAVHEYLGICWGKLRGKL